MPRVNRDLQRRMAARRERERRRAPGERRYQFATPLAEPEVGGEETEETAPQVPAQAPARTRLQAPPRGSIARPAPRPYAAYGPEYAYVGRELRRVALVVGLLLLALVILSFVLPR